MLFQMRFLVRLVENYELKHLLHKWTPLHYSLTKRFNTLVFDCLSNSLKKMCFAMYRLRSRLEHQQRGRYHIHRFRILEWLQRARYQIR